MKKYLLKDYISLLQEKNVLGEVHLSDTCMNTVVELVSCDSQQVVSNTLFLCKGVHFKAQYLQDAVNKGAFAYLSEVEYPEVNIPWIPLTNVRYAMANLATMYYNDPWKELNVIGLTGTKGKSTTTYYVKTILDTYLKRVEKQESAVISSIGTYDGVECFESHLTTPEPLDLERHFRNAVESKIDFVTMEVSSQALKYDRVLGVNFSVAAFLNIGYDHVSSIEHPTWEDYFASKLRIFEQCTYGLVNLDSEHYEEILEAAKASKKVVTFSETKEAADFYGYNVHKVGNDIVFNVRGSDFDDEFKLSMPGLFNVSNALCAIAIARLYDIPVSDIQAGLYQAKVPGRMEIYTSNDQKITAIVDYAHNQLSFQKLFESVRNEYPGYRATIVFGCPGKKAQDRRHDLGEIAGKYADYIYLTEEDAGEEDPLAIAQEIARAVEKEKAPYEIIIDRKQAIARAVEDAANVQGNTVILITGKGAETRQKRGTEYIPVMSDVECVHLELKKYNEK